MVESVRVEGTYEGKNLGIAVIAECNLRVADSTEPEEHILVAIMKDIKFCHLHSRAWSSIGPVS